MLTICTLLEKHSRVGRSGVETSGMSDRSLVVSEICPISYNFKRFLMFFRNR